MKCPNCGRSSRRSSEANRRYWSLINLLSEQLKPNGQSFSPESWHLYCKGRFMGMRDITLPSGQVVTVPLSSADLDTQEFHMYMTEVEVWCAENGIYLPDMQEAA